MPCYTEYTKALTLWCYQTYIYVAAAIHKETLHCSSLAAKTTSIRYHSDSRNLTSSMPQSIANVASKWSDKRRGLPLSLFQQCPWIVMAAKGLTKRPRYAIFGHLLWPARGKAQ